MDITRSRKLIITTPLMTGDIPHIAGALALDDETDVLVLFESSPGQDDALLKFYAQAAGDVPKRVKKYRPPTLDPPTSNEKAAHHLYAQLTDSKFDPSRLGVGIKPRIVKPEDIKQFAEDYLTYVDEDGSKNYQIISVWRATEIIADCFKKAATNPSVVYNHIIKTLSCKTANFQADMEAAIKGTTFGELPTHDKKILLLWARYSGQKEDGYNPAGDSDVVGQDQLSNVARALGFEVIRIGHGPLVGQKEDTKDCHIGEFYKKKIIDDAGRAGQVSFFVALKNYYTGGIIQMGQKTGGMDFAALIGIPTLYIEDKGSSSQDRMMMWIDIEGQLTVPYYRRALTEKPPSPLGKALRQVSALIKSENKAEYDKWTIENDKAKSKTKAPTPFSVIKEFERTVAWVYAFRKVLGVAGTSAIEIAEGVIGETQEKREDWTAQIEAFSEKDLELVEIPSGYTIQDMSTIETSLKSLQKEISM